MEVKMKPKKRRRKLEEEEPPQEHGSYDPLENTTVEEILIDGA
jgi:hypothetical protein